MVHLILYFLAVYSVTIIIIEEDGPFDIFMKYKIWLGFDKRLHVPESEDAMFDEWLNVQYDKATPEQLASPHAIVAIAANDARFWHHVLECHRCTGFYVGIVFGLIWAVGGVYALAPLAAVGAVMVIKEK